MRRQCRHPTVLIFFFFLQGARDLPPKWTLSAALIFGALQTITWAFEARRPESQMPKGTGLLLTWPRCVEYGGDQRENNYRKAAKLTYRSKRQQRCLFRYFCHSFYFHYYFSVGCWLWAGLGGSGGGALAGITCFFQLRKQNKSEPQPNNIKQINTYINTGGHA